MSKRQRGSSNFEVMEVTGVETDISHGVYDTLDEARGCVEYDKLTRWEIWQGDHIVEEGAPAISRAVLEALGVEEEVIGGPGWRDGQPPRPLGTISHDAEKLVRWVHDSSFACGEWRGDGNDETEYQPLHDEHEEADAKLTAYIAGLELEVARLGGSLPTIQKASAEAPTPWLYDGDGSVDVSDDTGVLGALESQYDRECECDADCDSPACRGIGASGAVNPSHNHSDATGAR